MPKKNKQVTVTETGDDEVVPFKYSISSYGADYTVDSLVARMRDEDIYVPHFQRGFVWSFGDASRFIESLLLGLPVPGIFLAKEYDSRRMIIVDGQQRLRTLQYFYDGVFANKREFALKGVQAQFVGLTYRSLPDSDRRQLADSIIHATIIRQDEPSDDESSVYYIFQRLNTTGVELKPQEIRSCIYHGPFNDLLSDLNAAAPWRALFGPPHRNMRDQELILRFFALYFRGDSYAKPMATFLNRYMGKNRHLKSKLSRELAELFLATVDTILNAIGENAFKPKKALNAAFYDAVMVGIARRLQQGTIKRAGEVRDRYLRLLGDDKFVMATETATTDEENVRRRLDIATKAFAYVK